MGVRERQSLLLLHLETSKNDKNWGIQIVKVEYENRSQ